MSFSEWKKVKLGDVVKVIDSLHVTPKYVENGYPIIRVQDIYEGLFDIKSSLYVTKEIYEKYTKNHKPQKGDILFTRVGANNGISSYVNTNKEFCIGQNTCILTGYSEEVYSKYIYYIMISNAIRNQIQSMNTGSTHKTISLKNINNFKFSIPSYNEQKAIADTLSCLDDKIELNNKINKTLEEMAQAIFKSWFVDFEPFQDGEFEDSELGRIPKGWRVVELSEIGRFVKGKKPKTLLNIKTSENEEQYLTIDVLNGGNPQFASIDKMIISNIYDVLMVMDGASSGTVYFGLKGIIGSTIAKFEVTHEQLREIVYQYLKTNESEVKAHNTGSAIPHTDKGYVSKCKIAVPDDEILKQIAMSLKKIRETIINNSNENQTLTLIRDTLLPKLMSGEIRVPIEEVK